MSQEPIPTPQIYVDADACPVKDEIYKVGERHGLRITYVSNAFMRLPEDALVTRVVVPDGPDVADNWIADRTRHHDIVITNDIPLAGRCVERGAIVLGTSGREFTEATIGQALASRALNQHLREIGEIGGSNPVFTPKARSDFLQAMESACRRARRG